MLKKKKNTQTSKRKRKFLHLFWIFLLLYVLAVCLPYKFTPKISEQTKKKFMLSDFYQDSPGEERASILVTNQEALVERLRLITNAKESLILSTFDFRSDNSGKLMLAALIDAAERGVRIDILVDGISYFLESSKNPYFYSLSSMEGVHFQVYNSVNLLSPTKIMARMHDKYLIADETAYILGGRNTYDFFLGDDTSYKNYDWDVLVISSPQAPDSSVNQLLSYYQSVRDLKTCRTVMETIPKKKKNEVLSCRKELSEILTQQKKDHPEWFEPIDYQKNTVETNQIRLLFNPMEDKVKEPVVFYNMLELMKASKEPVVFHTPYILCDSYMYRQLTELCSEAPSVTMMTNSVANNGNPFGSTDYFLHKKKLLKTGVHILEYDGGISYHGKCFSIGNRISGIGSFNWDMRSAYIDTELVAIIDSVPLNEQLQKAMKSYEKDALIVEDAKNYSLTDEQTTQPLPARKKLSIFAISLIDWLFRFLM